jgi:hypothetical protein
MKRICAESTEFFYLCSHDPIPSEGQCIDDFVVRHYSSKNLSQNILIDYSDTRVIISANPIDRFRGIIYYLYWDNDQNLNELDFHVKNDKFTDEEFSQSIVTVYEEIDCCNCQTHHKILSVPSDHCYIKNHELFLEKFRKRKKKLCPVCSSSLRKSVVKIFQEGVGA